MLRVRSPVSEPPRVRMAERNAPTRSLPQSNPIQVRFDRFELDEANARLLCDGKAVALAPTPFAVLCALLRQAGSLLTKHALLDEVWGHRFVSDSVLKTAISELRAVLNDDARHARFIETVSRRGYRFIAATLRYPPRRRLAQMFRPSTRRSRHPSLVARRRSRGFAAPGILRAAAAARLSGLPANRVSARRC